MNDEEFISKSSDAQALIDRGVKQGLEAAAKLVDHILKEGGGTYGDAIRALVPPADYCTHDQRPDVGAALSSLTEREEGYREGMKLARKNTRQFTAL